MSSSIPTEDRPLDHTPVHTADLPATPQRERSIPATAWIEAPAELLELAIEVGVDSPRFLRRIGPWLLWRAGPPTNGEARYLALHADDLDRRFRFALHADGSAAGEGPDGLVTDRFRAWKEALRDAR